MPLNLNSLVAPIALRPAVTLSDEELMRFSADNKGYHSTAVPGMPCSGRRIQRAVDDDPGLGPAGGPGN